MKRPTIDQLRERLGVPPDASAAPYLVPAPFGFSVDDFDLDSFEEEYGGGCIQCGEFTMEIEGGCDLHCEGCCGCDDEEDDEAPVCWECGDPLNNVGLCESCPEHLSRGGEV